MVAFSVIKHTTKSSISYLTLRIQSGVVEKTLDSLVILSQLLTICITKWSQTFLYCLLTMCQDWLYFLFIYLFIFGHAMQHEGS